MPESVEWKIESAEPVGPRCPSCYAETDYDDGWFVCRPCGLAWDADRYHTEPGFFYDSENQPCGVEEPANKIHLEGYLSTASPCLLPEGHETKEHYHLHRYQRTEEPRRPVVEVTPPRAPVIVDVELP